MDLNGATPSPKQLKYAKEIALSASLNSGHYPSYLGIEGPTQDCLPGETSALEFLLLLWPESLRELIAVETDRYAHQRGVCHWKDVDVSEVWTFLYIVVLVGIHQLPHIRSYWSKDPLLGIPTLHRYMSLNRFWALLRNLHVVDNEVIPKKGGVSGKIKPLLDTLGKTFFEQYSPGQELSVDEGMVKYKGRAGGKVVMPRKPIKKGFKI